MSQHQLLLLLQFHTEHAAGKLFNYRSADFNSFFLCVFRLALFFLMFEVWFKVPLFKGELDPLRFLGY